MYYIQRKDSLRLETVDQFEDWREAVDNCKEYNISDTCADYYISTRACKHWRESNE